ncbi:hypothetical protein HDU76_000068 [Blyttiomyces sp. JEL0837]|nr:hypothetical protein HDU76_000068 [Blyttiomyces sp. JEL0837]
MNKPTTISIIRNQHPISKTAGVNIPINAVYLSGYQVPVTLGNGQKFNLSVAFSSGFTWFRGSLCLNPSNDGSCTGTKDFGDGFISFDEWVGYGVNDGSEFFEQSWFDNVPGHTGNGLQSELGLYLPLLQGPDVNGEIIVGGSTVAEIDVIYALRYNFIAMPGDINNQLYTVLGATYDSGIGAYTVNCGTVATLLVVSVSVPSDTSSSTAAIFNISPNNCEYIPSQACLTPWRFFKFENSAS